MKYRRLCGTSLDVSVICMGPMRAATREPSNDEKSKAGEQAFRLALDMGVNFIHSSYEYGTRWMLHRVLKDHPKRSELHHLIKVPVPDSEDNAVFDPAKFRLLIEEALHDLCADRIDVLQYIVRSDPNTDERRIPLLRNIIEDVAGIFERMRDEGKVGYLMMFPYTVPVGKASIETGKFAGLIAYYNLVEMEMTDLFDDLRQRNMGFIAIRPLYQGILTDQRAAQKSLPEDDRFRDEGYIDAFAKRRKIADYFREEIGDSMTSFAIRFARADPVVASVVVGLNTKEQVEGIVNAADDDLLSVDVVDKAKALWRSGYGVD